MEIIHADKLISEGRVLVNGSKPQMGVKVSSAKKSRQHSSIK